MKDKKRLVKFDTVKGEVKFRARVAPEATAEVVTTMPAPAPVAYPMRQRVTRGSMPRITPKRPRLRR